MKNNKWFWLVELIVVSSIISVFTAIVVLHFSNTLIDSRNAIREKMVFDISLWLDNYKNKFWEYPMPENYSTISDWVNEISYQWDLKNNEFIFKNEFLDPRTRKKLKYSVSDDKLKKSVVTDLEINWFKNSEWKKIFLDSDNIPYEQGNNFVIYDWNLKFLNSDLDIQVLDSNSTYVWIYHNKAFTWEEVKYLHLWKKTCDIAYKNKLIDKSWIFKVKLDNWSDVDIECLIENNTAWTKVALISELNQFHLTNTFLKTNKLSDKNSQYWKLSDWAINFLSMWEYMLVCDSHKNYFRTPLFSANSENTNFEWKEDYEDSYSGLTATSSDFLWLDWNQILWWTNRLSYWRTGQNWCWVNWTFWFSWSLWIK